jgi:DNA/RNA-binding domain of Phe-tRNA-synthetase-like protein
MLLKHGQLPRINLLVDIYNLVSVKTHLSLGAHDRQKLGGDVHLKLTTGTERFWPIGTNELYPVKPGKYAYVDDDNDIICRLEVRQVEKTKVLPDTTACFFIVQGNPANQPGLPASCLCRTD